MICRQDNVQVLLFGAAAVAALAVLVFMVGKGLQDLTAMIECLSDLEACKRGGGGAWMKEVAR